ncbi:3-hydroxyacyl-CoA dehydrogenase NAD-binding domain-containing protein [Iodobacter fluviatilis]|uniref:3-hydroxybutyryl-CoA dehydrogenase n=1 Tax=Iodobacter fluviatilis TaxID=537 RepID=A0A7G3G7N1_9NEIS|nr:3-hydroxyacyl-CoA dehydrogenase NAD-binding domain-containing protein [Iodobacter fluviatilis]QBC43128.1 3-hydroxybutyryl-CoA dehydrogenase [Iodobacter fluviatilis]
MSTEKYIVGVVGAGVMGTSLVQLLSMSNAVETVYWRSARGADLNERMEEIFRYLDKLAKKGRISAEVASAAKNKIVNVKCFDEFIHCDFVHEAAEESLGVKAGVINKLNLVENSKYIIASNTSSISITDLSQAMIEPENLIGMHFFNPAPLMKLVEVIRGYHTSDRVENAVKKYAEAIGKCPVVVTDSPGFIVNRMLIPMINEAVCILAENVTDRDSIDNAMRFGANHPIGPLALSDLIGNDVVLSIMEVLYSETGDQKYRPHPYLKKMVRAKRLGKKVGKGFYDY